MVADFTAMVIVFSFKTCLDLLGPNISEICNFSFKEEVNILCVLWILLWKWDAESGSNYLNHQSKFFLVLLRGAQI